MDGANALSAWHVLSGDAPCEALLHTGKYRAISVVSVFSGSDVCTLKVDLQDGDDANILPRTNEIALSCELYGFPAVFDKNACYMLGVTCIPGVVVQVASGIGYSTCTSLQGTSGGPMISKGHIIGINLGNVGDSLAIQQDARQFNDYGKLDELVSSSERAELESLRDELRSLQEEDAKSSKGMLSESSSSRSSVSQPLSISSSIARADSQYKGQFSIFKQSRSEGAPTQPSEPTYVQRACFAERTHLKYSAAVFPAPKQSRFSQLSALLYDCDDIF
jgi:hypothetical protein